MDKVVVGLSGGVDSAVAAYLLKKSGYEVIGLTLRVWEADDGTEGRCCDIDDARRVSSELGISFYPVNCLSDFRKHVVDPFVSCYMQGLTPDPCVECNRYVKWEKLFYYARITGAKYIATGHYASIVRKDNGRYTVRKAVHSEKDQSYMLCKLTQEQLAATLMPLGNLSKSEVRQIAASAGLPVAKRKDSQEVCFVTDGSYTDFIEKSVANHCTNGGPIVDEAGNVLGNHKGLIHYTVGQRKDLGLSLGKRVYVKEIIPESNTIVVGDESSLYCREILCSNVNFMGISEPKREESVECKVMVRYHGKGHSAEVVPFENNKVKVRFLEPARAATPGQSAVFYDDDDCIVGGGTIEAVVK